MSRAKKLAIPLSLIVFLAVFGTGCGANEGVLRSGKETPTQINIANKKTTFDKELDAMRTAGFVFIYVVRRKDGGIIDAEDVSVIKLQTVDTNRRVKTDEDRAVIIGSNYQVPPDNLALLYDRFSVENYSEPFVEGANVKANSNK